MKNRYSHIRRAIVFALPLCSVTAVYAQDPALEEEEVVLLSPFEVSSERNVGYMALDTLAGTRIRTDLRDVGSSISVFTAEFMQDVGATDSLTLLTYAVSAEVGGTYSTYTGNGAGDGPVVNEADRLASPSTTTRVRGLAEATHSREFFESRIPWDGYNIERVELNRGANSILFGLGSAAGIINSTLIRPEFYTFGKVEARFGSYGSWRLSADYNQEIIDDVLAARVSAMREDENFAQDPAYEDDERIFAAIRYSPKLVEGGLTVLQANFERGNVIANRPRTVTPVDFITPFFRDALTAEERAALAELDSLDQLPAPLNELMGIGRQTFTPYQLEDDYSEAPNTGQRRSNYISGAPNPYYNPAVGNFAQLFGGPLAVFPDHRTGELSTYYMSEWRNVRGIGPDGEIDGGTGQPYQRLGGIAEYRNFATGVGLPYAEYGQYKNFHLQDASVFDFYNKLIDGPNKEERQDWTAYNFLASQTFNDNRFGVEFAYDRQDYYESRWAMLADQRVALHIDINSEWADGRPNPNVGRPFISDNGQYSTYSLEEEREVYRGTAFYELRVSDFVQEDSLIERILGRHNFTGLMQADEREQDQRAWLLYGTPLAYDDYVTGPNSRLNWTENVRIPNPVVYLGPSLLDRTTASGANIPNPSARINLVSGPLYNFDSTWNGQGVDPGAEWINPWNGEVQTQSENPANYVGWRNIELNPIYSERDGRDLQTTAADLERRRIESEALIWQGYFWNDAIVTTWGYRRDMVRTTTFRAPFMTDGDFVDTIRNVDPEVYQLPDEWQTDDVDHSYTRGLVVHVDQLHPTIDKALPLNVSLSYISSEIFNPVATRRDVYGQEIGNPTGGTEDYGLRLSTKDNRYSFSVTKFRTHLVNASSSAVAGDWFLGAVMAWGSNWADIFDYNLSDYTMETANPDDMAPGRYNYSPGEGETQEQAAAREAAAVASWKALENSINPAYWDAWGLDKDRVANQSASAPANFSLTEDSVSKGYEFEFTANPTPNWRISITAAKVKSIRSNVGGAALADFVNTVDTALNQTPAGDLRIWWGGAGNTTTLREWNATFMGNYALKQLQEGTSAPEIREWHFTLVTNYTFTEGPLAGFNIGGSYRWQDEVGLGYPVIETEDGFSYDLDRPYYGPSEDFVDLWIGYERDLTSSIGWRIQLNVRNVFGDEDLIPISVQPDGKTWAAVRIAPERTWFVTNTFTF